MINTDRLNPKKIDVYMADRWVGTLAETQNRAAFQYTDEWIETGFSISPLSLPLEKRLFIPDYMPFDGVFGVFADTLPDGWGRLIVDRYIKSKFKIDPDEIGGYQRLTLVSDAGMGALEYRPSMDIQNEEYMGSLDELAHECGKLLQEGSVDNLDELFQYGGSSGGARPKIHTKIDGEDWIIKFPATYDSSDIGVMEYEYSMCARECGIEVSEARLFESQKCGGYFGTKRFDRNRYGKKVHVISASGLLETSHRYPNLDYEQLIKLTLLLTQDMQETKKMYSLMCYNVFAHNRDDHSKNFSFLYNEAESRWKLSPAYDLTYSNSQGGEHATTVSGEGKNPTLNDILHIAKIAGIDARYAKSRANEIAEIVRTMLKKYVASSYSTIQLDSYE